MKVVIIGGHLSPALSVLEKLNKEDVLFVGRKFALEGDTALSLEYQFVEKLNVAFANINAGRLQRNLTKHTIPSLLKIPKAVFVSLKVLKDFNPDVVIGFGGYVSLPVCIAAKILRIPIVIHEQTLEAGAANKIISKFAEKICISWKSSEKFFPKGKTILTGNPLRKEILDAKQIKNKFNFKNNLPVIYITGGSLGSHFINTLLENSLLNLLEKANIIHQTGDAKVFLDFEKFERLRKSLPDLLKQRYIISKFFEVNEVSKLLRKSDMVISRSGINTISELIYFKKPALLIPLLTGQKKEQLKNAFFLKNLGLAEIIEQDNVDRENFLEAVNNMLRKLDQYKINSSDENILNNESADKIINILKDVAKK